MDSGPENDSWATLYDRSLSSGTKDDSRAGGKLREGSGKWKSAREQWRMKARPKSFGRGRVNGRPLKGEEGGGKKRGGDVERFLTLITPHPRWLSSRMKFQTVRDESIDAKGQRPGRLGISHAQYQS
ncbi:hypothetical protein KM043_008930 [Ampulex compressa]|nr:hypothetical protein KM043_008930 [Ampulex compressa]